MKTVIDYLRYSYMNYPDKIACADEKDEITYSNLWEESERIGSWFIENCDMSIPIAIVAIKSIEVLKVIWAIVKAGGCYSVIDPMLPVARISNMLSTLSPQCIVASTKYRKKISITAKLVDIDNIINFKGSNSIHSNITDTSPLYIMFTSGSTGVPKGVVVNHRSVVDFIDVFTEKFSISDKDVIGNQAPWDFDVSVKDIFSAAKTGAQIQIIPRKMFSFPQKLVKYLDDNRVTTLIWASSALRIISSSNALEAEPPKCINKIIFSGEVMPSKHYNIWRRHYPNALFANVYGPTEITCNCTYYIQNGLIEDDEVIPIGAPFDNEKVFLLDESDRLINSDVYGICGEICVSGTAVSMGYYANHKASNAAFVQNPLNRKYREIIYRTGDLAYYTQSHQLVYCGRKDNQIKHNGHRIELEEIERAINALSEISVGCCIYKNECIIAFVVGSSNEKTIKNMLLKILPNYMIPERIVFIDNLPLNEHGKIDRNVLINMEI